MMAGIKSRLDSIRKASKDVKSEIDEILERDDKIELATIEADAYSRDLFRLMREMAEAANPVLEKLGLSKEAIDHDIEEYVGILADNPRELYFASVNVDAKYSRNKYVLGNLSKWLTRLERSIGKIEEYLDTETEEEELSELFAKIDKTKLPAKKKKELKGDFLKALNRLNR